MDINSPVPPTNPAPRPTLAAPPPIQTGIANAPVPPPSSNGGPGFFSRFKILIGLAVFAIMAVAIPLTLNQVKKNQESRSHAAAPPIAILLSPQSKNVDQLDFLGIDVTLDTNQNNVTAVDITFAFDKDVLGYGGPLAECPAPTDLSHVDCPSSDNISPFVPDRTFTTILNKVDYATGTVHFVGINPTATTITGPNVKLGIFQFRGGAAGTGRVSFTNIHVNAAGIADAVPFDSDRTVGGTYTVGGGAKTVRDFLKNLNGKGTFKCTSGCAGLFTDSTQVTITQINFDTARGYFGDRTWLLFDMPTLDSSSTTYKLASPADGNSATVILTGRAGLDGKLYGTGTREGGQSVSWMIEPLSQCAPRPACLDAEVPCKIPEPAPGWCAPTACGPKDECPNGYTCQVVGSTGSIPGNAIKQCVANNQNCTPIPTGCRLVDNGSAECVKGDTVGLISPPKGGWCPANSNDIRGYYKHVGTCTAGPCLGSGPQTHYMKITDENLATGAFSGKGFYSSNPALTWDITGTVTGSSITYHLVNSPNSYTVDGTGNINSDQISGTLTSNHNESATWVWTKQAACINKPACVDNNPHCDIPVPDGGWCPPPPKPPSPAAVVWAIGTNTPYQQYPNEFGVFHRTGDTWTAVNGGGTKITVGPDGNPWVLNSSNQIFHYVNGAFQQVPGAAREIDAGADGSVWAIGTNTPYQQYPNDYGIYKWTGTTWTPVNGGGVKIAVGPDGNPWVINSFGNIFHYVNGAFQQIPGAAREIDAGADGSVWVIGANNSTIYHLKPDNSWEAVDGSAIGVGVAPDGTPWVVNSGGAIYHRVNNAWVNIPGLAKDIDVGETSTLTFTVNLPGIGPAGGGHTLNSKPTNMYRDLDIKLIDSANKVTKLLGETIFDGSSFVGLASLPEDLAPGAYVVKINTYAGLANTLWKRFDGIFNLSPDRDTAMPAVTLVSGDINEDNQINLADYNIILSCINNNGCDNVKKRLTDLNDDGKTDETDLNIMFAGLSKRSGD